MKHMAYKALLVATLLLACQQISGSDTEDDISAIENQLSKFEEIFLSSEAPIEAQLQEYLEYFVDDLVLLPPGEDAVQGYDAALAYYTEGFAGGTILNVNYHMHVPEIFLNGDMAIRRYFGSSEIKIDGQDENYSSYHRYIDILRRQADGEWRMVWHAWTPVDQ